MCSTIITHTANSNRKLLKTLCNEHKDHFVIIIKWHMTFVLSENEQQTIDFVSSDAVSGLKSSSYSEFLILGSIHKRIKSIIVRRLDLQMVFTNRLNYACKLKCNIVMGIESVE